VLERPTALHAAAVDASPAPRDRRGHGVAGVTGALLSSGERVLLVCADVPRRRAALERLVAGLAGRDGGSDSGEPVGACSWATLAADTALAKPYEHLVAIDPPREPAQLSLLGVSDAPATGATVHLAWGAPEAEFALALARFELDLRAPLAALYRGLRDGASVTEGEGLERLLRGDGAHPRSSEACALLLRVLVELELVEFDAERRACRVVAGGGRTQLERSPTYVAAMEALTGAERYLADEGAAVAVRAA
jgi:single-stranded-DNA-specific exonuclease